MRKKKISLFVKTESYQTFKKAVLAKWGKLHASLGEELGNAMDRYVENHLSHPELHARTHVQAKLSTRGLNTTRRIFDRIRTRFTSEILERDVVLAIQHEAGTDARTVRNYKQVLTGLGWLKVKIVGDFRKPTIYEIAAEPETLVETPRGGE